MRIAESFYKKLSYLFPFCSVPSATFFNSMTNQLSIFQVLSTQKLKQHLLKPCLCKERYRIPPVLQENKVMQQFLWQMSHPQRLTSNGFMNEYFCKKTCQANIKVSCLPCSMLKIHSNKVN